MFRLLIYVCVCDVVVFVLIAWFVGIVLLFYWVRLCVRVCLFNLYGCSLWDFVVLLCFGFLGFAIQ